MNSLDNEPVLGGGYAPYAKTRRPTRPDTDPIAVVIDRLARAMSEQLRLTMDDAVRAAALAVAVLDAPALAPRWRPTTSAEYNDPTADDEAYRRFRDLVLHSDGTESVATQITAEAVGNQVRLDYTARWERAVNIDGAAGPTRGTPEDPDQYVRRLVLFGGWQDDPNGKAYFDQLVSQLDLMRDELRQVERRGDL